MVQFGDKFKRWLIPEWKQQYCNYDKLKKILRKIEKKDDPLRKFEKPIHPL